MTTLASVLSRATAIALPKPAEDKKVTALANAMLARTREAARGHPEVVDVILGGSFAKGTWIPRHADIDIFVRFGAETREDRFEELGLSIGAKATRGYPRGKKYAQHPYTEATVDGLKVNIVPCYAVEKGKWKSAADRSPFHIDLVKVIPEEQKTQVRLLKSFMNGVGVYGAEIETQGFSGYVAEVLTMQHGDLAGALKFFADFKRHDEKRLFSLPDPVDPSRDLAIAVSGEKLGRMILASRVFLKKPGLGYFTHMTGKGRPAVADEVLAVVFTHAPLSEDTLWGELRRTMKHTVRHVEMLGFKIARVMAASNNKDSSAFLFVPEFPSLPRFEQRVGPTVDLRKETESFLSVNARKARLVWVDDDARVRILQERERTKLTDALGEVAKGRAGPIGASEEVARGMKKTGKVLWGSGLKRATKSQEWLRRGVREIVSDALGTRSR